MVDDRLQYDPIDSSDAVSDRSDDNVPIRP